ncbi:MAG: universal stress protein [Gammaproteobacteria bacterium]
MATYEHILIAVDLTQDSETVGQRACKLAKACGAQLSLLHVVEYVPVDPAGEAMLPPPVNMEDELVNAARLRLDGLAEKLGISDCSRYVEIGNIKSELGRIAKEQAVDLIVLGSRERHGLALLLGSTEKSVVGSAPCDVLAVRLH